MIKLALWISMFGLMTVLDYTWAKYNRATVEGNATKAGLLAIAIYVLGAAGVLGYTDDRWLLIPSCAGAFVGTYFATRKEKAA